MQTERAMFDERRCTLCPRRCGADRKKGKGFCGAGSEIRIARAAPHMWEEPCISGTGGSGTIFFSGCALKCVFCQNAEISSGKVGATVSAERFKEICFELKDMGVHNISLVTADHYVPYIVPALKDIKGELGLPIVFNCSGYESREILEMLDGVVDIYLDDLKYHSSELSQKMAGVPDYFDVAASALDIMIKQCGAPVIEDGIMKRGVIVRNLILPGYRKDSMEIIRYLKDHYGPDDITVSLMSQYTPNGADGAPARRITSFEYQSVFKMLENSRFNGYYQELSSADSYYTPDFDLEGVLKSDKL